IQVDLVDLGYFSTIVDPADFGTTSFAGFDAIWLGWGSYFPGLALRQADLINFVNGGGNLLAEIALPLNDISEYPFGSEVTDVFTFGQNDVHIVDPSDPVNAGLTDADLSDWDYSYLDVFPDIGSFHGLTASASDPSLWVTICRPEGAGSII